MTCNARISEAYAYETLNRYGKVAYLDTASCGCGSIPSHFLYANALERIDLYDQFATLDLSRYSALAIPMGVDEIHLSKHQAKILDYLNQGGIVLSFASNYSGFLPNNGGYIQSQTPIKDRSLFGKHALIFEGVRDYDLNHRRGVKGFFNRGYFEAPAGAEVILEDSEGRCVGYIDRDSSNGVILATASADLLWFGLFDNTTARRLGVNLLRWLEQELEKRDSSKLDSSKTLTPSAPFAFTKVAPSPEPKRLKNAIITGGSAYNHHFFTNKNSKYANFFDRRIYAPELGEESLEEFDYILIASRLEARHLIPHKEKFKRYLEQGGHIISLGEVMGDYLPEVTWKEYEVNFWWWLIPEADTPLYIEEAGKTLFERLSVNDAKWHYHGAFYPPKGAVKILSNELGESIIYKDSRYGGTLYVSSLDPDYHFGQGFMPKTEPFFDELMRWIHQEIEATKKGKES